MYPGPDGAGDRVDEGLLERVDGIAAWISDLDARVRATELATGDEKSAKELRRAVEALSKHDPKLEKRLTNRVDVLADRLATLASTVSTTAAALAKKDGEIAGLRRELEERSRRIDALDRERGKAVGSDEVDKLRSAIKAVAAERTVRSSDSRVDGLGGKVDYLTERVDTLAKTVATTAAGLVGREGEIATLRQRLDEGSARIEQAAAELRRVQSDGTFVERLDALKRAVETTSAGLAGREGEIAAVRARIDEAYTRVGTVVSDLQQSIATLASQVAALEEVPGVTEQALEDRANELTGRVDGLAGRVDTLATNVETALSGLAEKELEIASLNRHVGDASSRVDTVVTELRQAVAALPEPGALDPALEARLEGLTGDVVAATAQLTALEAAGTERAEEASARSAAFERLLAEVGARLDAVERDRDAAAAQLTRAGEAWTEEREWVRAQLQVLAAAHAETSEAHEGLGPVLEALAARLDSMEGDHAAVTAEIARVSDALEAERASLHTQLDGLAAALAESASASPTGGGDSEHLLAALAGRLDSVEQDGAAVASEIARTAAFWATELDSIEARLTEVTSSTGESAGGGADEETARLLGELAGRLDAMEQDRRTAAYEIARVSASWAAERSSLEGRLDEVTAHLADVESDVPGAGAAAVHGEEIAQLRVLVDGLRMRLASSEQELAALVGSRDVGPRIDEVTRRLESLERAPIIVAGSADGGPLAGDGRFRLELRALELRMEHAEAAARENREAVLVQLERLAARIEWRFQRLEAAHDAAYPEAVGGGAQVVPIRGLEV